MSTLKATNLQHASAANPAIVLAADGSATAQVSSINGGPLAGFRNAIINGNFDIWQRGTSQSTLGYGSADRWLNNILGSSCTMSRQAFTLGQTAVPGEPTYFCRMAVTSVAGSGNLVNLQQRIEDVRTFADQQVTVSFWAKADAAKPIAVELLQYFGSGGSPSANVDTIGATKTTLSTSWQKVTVTATMPSISGKTIGTDNNSFIQLNIWFDAGSNFNSRTGTLGQQSGTFDIAQVQVEPGTVATPFERRSYGQELALCQRYYEEVGAFFIGNVTTATAYGTGFTFAVEKRAIPTMSSISQGGAANGSMGTRTPNASSRKGGNTTGAATATISAAGFSDVYAASIEL